MPKELVGNLKSYYKINKIIAALNLTC